MILSVSRRTDVPRYYFEWFLHRLEEGYVLVRNPMNPHMVSRVALNPDVVDCIVFWTKDAGPMLAKLDALKEYAYYVQFTLNPYGVEMESGLRPREERLQTFLQLSEKIGAERTVWRYSPVLLNDVYAEQAHLAFFEKTAAALQGHTLQCKLSFLDMYEKIRENMRALKVGAIENAVQIRLAKQFLEIAKRYGIQLSACGNLALPTAGIPPAKCVDDGLVSRVLGEEIRLGKDNGQRGECSCVASVDIGAYNTCLHGCAYCYANISDVGVQRVTAQFSVDSPLLCSTLGLRDVVKERTVKRLRGGQTQMPGF